MNKETKITIFTPTYNRKYKLPCLYESLIKQTNKNFEWLIVDDGSTDGTNQLIEKYIQENKIKIRYIYQQNGGKHVATNTGIRNTKTDYFFCVDSDDYISTDCIQKLNSIITEIDNDDGIIGIIAHKCNIENKKKFKNIPKKYIKLEELYSKYHFKGELAIIIKTKFLINNEFPVVQGEKFVTEGWLYDRLDTRGNYYFLQEEIYYFKYLDDGYTKGYYALIKNNVNGYEIFCEQRMNIGYNLITKLKGAAFYNICQFIKHTPKTYIFKHNFAKLVLTYFPALIYYNKNIKGLK